MENMSHQANKLVNNPKKSLNMLHFLIFQGYKI